MTDPGIHPGIALSSMLNTIHLASCSFYMPEYWIDFKMNVSVIWSDLIPVIPPKSMRKDVGEITRESQIVS